MKRFLLLILAFALIKAHAQPFPCTLPACNGTIVNETYSSTAGWTNLSSGKMNIASGSMNYMYAGDVAGPLRMYKHYPAISANTNNLYADFWGSFSGNVNHTYYPLHYLLCLSSNSGEPMSTNNDALFVMITSTYLVPGTLKFQLAYKDGAGPVNLSASSIPYPGAGIYYFRVIRSSTNYQLYVATDPGFTSLIPGAPIHMYVCDLITDLKFVQHGRYTTDIKRKLGVKIDDLKICPYTSGCAFGATPCRVASGNGNFTKTDSEIYLYPNPTSVSIFISNKKTKIIDKVKILNLNGSLVKWVDLKQSAELSSIPVDDLKNGFYLVEIHTNDKVYQQKLSIQH